MKNLKVPEFTIQADSEFGLQSMITIMRIAREMLSRDEQIAIKAKLREFDLYEELNRPLPNLPPGGMGV